MFAKTVLENEFDLGAKHSTFGVTRAMLMMEDSDPQQLETAHTRDMSKGMSRILAYRVLDISQWLRQSVWTPPASPVIAQDMLRNFVGRDLLKVLVRLCYFFLPLQLQQH
jgi:hypothetical protein